MSLALARGKWSTDRANGHQLFFFTLLQVVEVAFSIFNDFSGPFPNVFQLMATSFQRGCLWARGKKHVCGFPGFGAKFGGDIIEHICSPPDEHFGMPTQLETNAGVELITLVE